MATATAIGLVVDCARMPVYFATQGSRILALWPLLLAAVIGTLAGTLLGERVLRRIPPAIFRRVVAVILLALGLYMIVRR